MILSDKNVKCELNDNVMTAFIKGEVDHHNAKAIRSKIDDDLYSHHPKELILDLSGVNFMDSSGLGLILGRYTKATDLGIGFKVQHPTPATLKILDLAGTGRIITIEK